jgi:hypothetical protein
VDFVLKLLHVRNPHGTNEWVGRFNDMDWETWHAFPEALKATGHKVGTKDRFRPCCKIFNVYSVYSMFFYVFFLLFAFFKAVRHHLAVHSKRG